MGSKFIPRGTFRSSDSVLFSSSERTEEGVSLLVADPDTSALVERKLMCVCSLCSLRAIPASSARHPGARMKSHNMF